MLVLCGGAVLCKIVVAIVVLPDYAEAALGAAVGIGSGLQTRSKALLQISGLTFPVSLALAFMGMGMWYATVIRALTKLNIRGFSLQPGWVWGWIYLLFQLLFPLPTLEATKSLWRGSRVVNSHDPSADYRDLSAPPSIEVWWTLFNGGLWLSVYRGSLWNSVLPEFELSDLGQPLHRLSLIALADPGGIALILAAAAAIWHVRAISAPLVEVGV